MRNRFLIFIIVVLVALSLFFLGRFIKKSYSTQSNSPGPKEQAAALSNVNSYLKEAEAFEEMGSLIEAKEIYRKVMDTSLSSEQLGVVQNKLENLNIKILLSGINIEQSQTYEVKPGDVLVNIAKQFNTTVDAIAKANNIKENIIRPGMRLRILKGKFSIFVDKSQNILLFKFNDEVVKTYNVSTGRNNSTPVGVYTIKNKLVNPVWFKDGHAIPATDPNNILGTRWMGFEKLPEYGIHGTTSPQDIGKQVTDGCARLKNEDVEELYSLIPVGTEVMIVD